MSDRFTRSTGVGATTVAGGGKVGRPRRRRAMSACAAASVPALAASAIAGILPMAHAAAQATVDGLSAVWLTASDSSLQPVIDQILAEMQQAVAYDSALPFATPENNAQLPTLLQNWAYLSLIQEISRATPNNPAVYFHSPEAVAGDAANSRGFFGVFDPGKHYDINLGLDPHATYELSGTVGKGTEALSILGYAYSGAGSGSASTSAGLELGDNLVVNPDGTFTVYIGPTEPSGAVNYMSNPLGGLLIRDDLGNFALGPGSINIECIADCPAANPDITDTGLSGTAIANLLNDWAATLPGSNNLEMISAEAAGAGLPANTMIDFASEASFPAGKANQLISVGNYDLQPGQALIVKVPEVEDAQYSSIQLENIWGVTLPSTLSQTSLNNVQAFHGAGGYAYYVISATNPGVANWLDTGGLPNGEVFLRLEGVPDPSKFAGQPVTTEVVPVSEVSQYLPADTPTVSLAQSAAVMNERVLSYDYALDTSRNSSWVTQELYLHDLQSAMGAGNFESVFGEQPFTPTWLRLTPALSPDGLALTKAFLTDPSGSWSAIQDNWNLAMKDITLPIQLAQALLEKNFDQTSDAVQSALAAGDLSQALTALFTGGQQFGTIVGEALFDPNTSIISGLLNARDDLATAVFTATGGFPDVANPLATLEWVFLPELSRSGWDFSALLDQATWANLDLGTVLNSDDYLAMLFDQG